MFPEVLQLAQYKSRRRVKRINIEKLELRENSDTLYMFHLAIGA